MNRKLKNEYLHWIREILKSKLSAKNKTTAINSLAVPVIQYSLDSCRTMTIRQKDL